MPHVKIRFVLGLLLAALLLRAGLGGAEETADAAARQELAPSGTLRVAIGVSSAGGAFWSDRDAAGHLHGVPIDLGTALAQRLGVPVAFVPYDNSGRITDAAAKGEWDVSFLPMDKARAEKLDFGPVYSTGEATFLVRGGVAAETIADLDKPELHLAAVANTTTMRGAAATLTRAKITGYETFDEILAGLKSGAIDAFALGREQLQDLARQLPGARVLPGSFLQIRAAVAVPSGHKHALAYVTRFIEEARTNGILRNALDHNGMKAAPI